MFASLSCNVVVIHMIQGFSFVCVCVCVFFFFFFWGGGGQGAEGGGMWNVIFYFLIIALPFVLLL